MASVFTVCHQARSALTDSCLCAVNMTPSTSLLLCCLPFKTSWWFSGVLVCRKSSWPPLWRDQLSRQQGLKTGTMRPFSSFDRQPSTQTAEAFVSRKPRCRSSPCALAVFGCFWLLLVLREGREQRLCVFLCVRTWLTAIKGKSTL